MGQLSHCSIGLWPWHPSNVAATRSVYLNIDDLVAYAQALATDRLNGEAWLKSCAAFDYEQLSVLLLALRDSKLKKRSRSAQLGLMEEVAEEMRKPHLAEMTVLFSPADDIRLGYHELSEHSFIGRALQHNRYKLFDADHLSAMLVKCRHIDTAPFAIFGLPMDTEEPLWRCLAHRRFQNHGLDAVLVDLSQRSLRLVGPSWLERFKGLLRGLARMKNPPGVQVIVEDGFTLGKVQSAFQEVARTTRNPRRAPQQSGLYLPSPSFLGQGPVVPPVLNDVSYEAVLKAPELQPVAQNILGYARQLDGLKQPEAARAVRGCLGYLRRLFALPVGHREASALVEKNQAGRSYAERSEADVKTLRGLAIDVALADLGNHGAGAPAEVGGILKDVRRLVIAVTTSWADDTPVSLLLGRLVRQPGTQLDNTLFVVPDMTNMSVFALSPYAHQTLGFCLPSQLAEANARLRPKRIIVLAPVPKTIRRLLTLEDCAEKVLLVGDAGVNGLLQPELWALADMAGLEPFQNRAWALLDSLGIASDNIEPYSWMLEEAKPAMSQRLDFTRGPGGEEYSGPVRVLTTSQGYHLYYREGSEVPRQTTSEIQVFERARASSIETGQAILVCTDSLMARLKRAIGTAAPQQVDVLRAYHRMVADLRRNIHGWSLTEQAVTVAQRMNRLNPKFREEEAGNVRRWLSVEADTMLQVGGKPTAPRYQEDFLLFCRAIGLNEQLAEYFWNHGIRETRSDRISEGHRQHERVMQFIFDPDGAVGRMIPDDERQALWRRIMDNVDIVVEEGLLGA